MDCESSGAWVSFHFFKEKENVKGEGNRCPEAKEKERISFVCVGRGGRIAAAGMRNVPETSMRFRI